MADYSQQALQGEGYEESSADHYNSFMLQQQKKRPRQPQQQQPQGLRGSAQPNNKRVKPTNNNNNGLVGAPASAILANTNTGANVAMAAAVPTTNVMPQQQEGTLLPTAAAAPPAAGEVQDVGFTSAIQICHKTHLNWARLSHDSREFGYLSSQYKFTEGEVVYFATTSIIQQGGGCKHLAFKKNGVWEFRKLCRTENCYRRCLTGTTCEKERNLLKAAP